MDNNTEKKFRLKGLLTLAGTLIAAVALLVYFLPRETKFGYEFEQGRPWRYNSLIAPYDFPVYKTTAEVEAERDSALRSFQPFYVENPQVENTALSNFAGDVANGNYHGVPSACLRHVQALLTKVYEAGIIDSEKLSQMAQSRTTAIRVVEGTEDKAARRTLLHPFRLRIHRQRRHAQFSARSDGTLQHQQIPRSQPYGRR